jgi:hypothetical protein
MSTRRLLSAAALLAFMCTGANVSAQVSAPVVDAPAAVPPAITPPSGEPAVTVPADEAFVPPDGRTEATPVTAAPVTAEPATATPVLSFLIPPAKLPDEEVADFLRDPQALLTANPTGGMVLSGRVFLLTGSSSDALSQIVTLSLKASKEQITALGSGLARAAKVAAETNPIYAAMIQSKVAEMNSEALSLAFVESSSEVQTAALGAGAAGGASSGASGIGGDGTAGGGSAGDNGDDFVITSSGEFNGMRDRSPFEVRTSDSVSPN